MSDKDTWLATVQGDWVNLHYVMACRAFDERRDRWYNMVTLVGGIEVRLADIYVTEEEAQRGFMEMIFPDHPDGECCCIASRRCDDPEVQEILEKYLASP